MKFIPFLFLSFICLVGQAQSPKRVNFTPSNYYSFFAAETKPVLNILPGDTIYTSSVILFILALLIVMDLIKTESNVQLVKLKIL
ncbi:MAG: hypothetical protein RL262_427 [Bacteroidota bacterium]